MSEEQNKLSSTSDISIVSKTLGIPSANIRAWENRYGVVQSIRTEGGRRRYSKGDVKKLSILKLLIDQGHKIGDIARISNDELIALTKKQTGENDKELFERNSHKGQSILLIGQHYTYRLIDIINSTDFGYVFEVFNGELEDLTNEKASQHDIIIVDAPFIDLTKYKSLLFGNNTNTKTKYVLLYSFSNSSTTEELDGYENVFTILTPINIYYLKTLLEKFDEEFRKGVEGVEVYEEDKTPRERLYTNRELAILSQITSSIDCECPQHLGQIISNLVAFEEYSRSCIDKNAKDAMIHKHLFQVSSTARAMLEGALSIVISHENIKI